MTSSWHIYIVGLCFVLISGIYFGLYYYTSSAILLGLGIVTLLTTVGLVLKIHFSKYISYLILALLIASAVFNTVKGPKALGHNAATSITDWGVLLIVTAICIYCVVVIHFRFKSKVVETKTDLTA